MYVMISHGIPESRTCYIDNKEWTWNHIEMEKPSCESFEDTGVSSHHLHFTRFPKVNFKNTYLYRVRMLLSMTTCTRSSIG